MNNPLKYTDPTGESFWRSLGNAFSDAFQAVVNVAVAVVTVAIAVVIIPTALAIGTVVGIGQFVGSGFQNSSILNNQFRIVGGLFQGNIGQIASRLTKELPQTLMGLGVSLGANALGRVRSVNYYGGATVVQHYQSGWGGFTLASYINGDSSIEANPNNPLFQHEYGHYLQSQEFGLSYMRQFALPSLFDTFGDGDHRQHFAEQDANSRAFTYFNQHIENYNGWNQRNTINGYNFNNPFSDIANQLALSNNLKRPRWYRFEF